MTQHAIDETPCTAIPVRDGCQLSARIWQPVDSAPVPAILEILPYRKRDGTETRDATTHPIYAAHGYACLRVDLRGTGESEGLFDDEYSEQELCDIEDVIAWIAAQPWCTGAVGIMGISWGGFNGLQVAARRPDALKAVISACSSVDRFADDIHYKGGCELTESVNWATHIMSWFSLPPDPEQTGNWRDVWLNRLENTPFAAAEWARHRTRDAYWRHASICEDFAAIDTPILSIAGWHDGYRNTPAKLLEGVTNAPVKAIIGPWNHKYPHIATPKPRIDFIGESLRWWDRWLKGIDTGVEADPALRAYVMDSMAPARTYPERAGRWVGLPDWPAPQVTTHDLPLGDGSLGGNGLSAPVSVTTDARAGEAIGRYFPCAYGALELPGDQRDDDARAACFDSEPLDAPFTVLGAPVLRLRLSSDQPFGQLVVRLCDVAPDGASTLICYGLLNLQFRDGFAQAVPLTPGAPVDATVTLDQMAYRLPGGHRLRLAVQTSCWPLVWPAPGQVTLSLLNGTLSLPELTGDAQSITFDAPRPLPESILREHRAELEQVERACENGHDVIRIRSDFGAYENIETGLLQDCLLEETYAIDPQDVAKASILSVWTRKMSRGDFNVATIVTARFETDASQFRLITRLEAFDGDSKLFERTFEDTIERNAG
ncbi:CocE/NonD family hydrolase [Citreicella sp. C3M06]|uniref:CocE/NonD family hydrolase n=1 Tax=Citreicella sp. C3M06 TaxID=2841564 RepID=UPI001C085D6B|nr:CocE/NonD family hydrolase [Citreicella sp. C3M06]MBU2959255.1 CocE/NonD family hydrolase [Citreicella sp. C3M06]